MTPEDLQTPKFRAVVANTFAADAALDADRFCEGLTADAVFQLGSQPPVVGREAVRAMVAQTFQAFRQVHHTLHRAFEQGETLIYEASVDYGFQDGRALRLDYVNVIDFAGDRVQTYRIYIDLSGLFR